MTLPRSLCFFLISFHLFSGVCFAASTEAKTPRLVVENPNFRFDSVRQGTKVEHTFKLSNQGEAVLKIERIHTSCGCTAAVVDSDTIAPGRSTELKASFDTSEFQGEKIKTIRLYTNDSKQPSIVLSIAGMVKPDIVASSSRIQFGDLRQGISAVKTVFVTAPKELAVKFQEPQARSEHLSVLSEPYTKDNQEGKKITIRIKETAPVGIFRERVSIATSSANNPVVNLPVFAKIRGSVNLNPPSVSFGLLDSGKLNNISKTVLIEEIGGKALDISSIESDNPGVLVQRINSIKPSLQVRLAQDIVGAFRARVTIRLNIKDSGEQQLVLPVYGIVNQR